MSIRPRWACLRRAASRDASRRASGCTRAAQLGELLGVRGQEVDLLGLLRHGRARHLVAPAHLGGPPPHLVGDHLAERGDALADLAAQHLLGERLPLARVGAPRRSARIRASSVSGESMRSAWYADQVGCPRRARRDTGCPTPPDRGPARRRWRGRARPAPRCRPRGAARRARRAARRRRPGRPRRRRCGHVDLAARPRPARRASTGRRARRTPGAGPSGAAARRPGPRAAARGGAGRARRAPRAASTASPGPTATPCRRSAPTNVDEVAGQPVRRTTVAMAQFSRSSAAAFTASTGA